MADLYDGDWIAEEGAARRLAGRDDGQERADDRGAARGVPEGRAAGVRLAFGTDSGVYPHGRNAIQFGYQVRHGQTPAGGDPLGDGRRGGCMGWETGSDRSSRAGSRTWWRFGSDPLVDIEALRTPLAVVKGGATVG